MVDDRRPLEDRVLTTERLVVCGGLVVVFYIIQLALPLAKGLWLSGGARNTDFLVFWSAGSLALDGHAASAYDWPALEAIERGVVGNVVSDLPWVYPPTFLLAVAPLALIPYVPAFFAWLSATLVAYLAALYAIVPRRSTIALALAAPPVLWNCFTGQNGFLTAALLGGSLALLDARPVAAGVLLGLLSYKPQFGLLFPLALALTGRWRVFSVAAATAASMAGLSSLAFGIEAWEKFFASSTAGVDAVFSGSELVLWARLQSVYALIRWLGGGTTLAAATHGAVALGTTAIVCLIWLRPAAYSWKAAALSAGALIVTPRLLVYDMTALAVPVAFFVQARLTPGPARGFRPGERWALLGFGAAAALPLWGVAPLGSLLALGLLGLISACATSAELSMGRA
jgi:glycosyl transferase family 87